MRLTEAERAVLASTLDHLGVGTVILNEAGQILTSSDTARALLAARHWAITSGNPLVAPDRATDENLQKQIQSALMAQPGNPVIHCMTVAAVRESSPLRLLVKSIPRNTALDTQRRAAVALFLRDALHCLAPRAEVLQMLFALTPAEACFARLIAAGASMERAGRQLGITRNTCKSRLRSIFIKTGATRQAALVGLLRDSLVWL